KTIAQVHLIAGVLVFGAGLVAAQNSNDSTYNNGGEVAFFYSSPRVGGCQNADLCWRAHTGANFMNDVDAALGGSLMEVDGYYESLFDTDWSTTPHFYTRGHLFNFNGTVPDLTSYCAGTSGGTVIVGP